MYERRLFTFVCETCGTRFRRRRRPADRNRFCSKSCVWQATKGPDYNAALAREHNPPRNRATRGSGVAYVKVDGRHEHRTIAEETLGRPLLPGEIVFHRDRVKGHNDPGNLAVMSRAELIRLIKPRKGT
jgi:hypothetical protein